MSAPSVQEVAIIHLLGGIRAATHPNGHLVLYPRMDGSDVEFPSVRSTNAYIPNVRRLGLMEIGVEELSCEHQLVHSHWYLLEEKVGMSPDDGGRDLWSQIAYGAYLAGETIKAEIAGRIAFALAAASRRLRDVSEQYYFQNRAACEARLAPDAGFSNLATFDLYLAIHSCLMEMASARDYLARFIAVDVIKGASSESMSGLRKEIIKKGLSHPLGSLVVSICDKTAGGWMAQLSEYRDIVVHRSPVTAITQNDYATCREIGLLGGASLRAINVGLPADAFSLKGPSFVDALERLNQLLRLLIAFSREVARQGSVVPQQVHLQDSDLK